MSEIIEHMMKDIKFGEITIKIQDGIPINIVKTENIRVKDIELSMKK